MHYSLLILFLSLGILLKAEEQPKDTLVVGFTSAAPFILTDGEEPRGINIWLWQKIANSLELEYEYKEMDFKEMLIAIEEGSIDISINPLTITSERSKKMNFTHSYYVSNSTIVKQESSSLEKFVNFINSFFSVNFLRGILLLVIIISIFGLMTWLFERGQNNQQFRSGFNGIWDGLWWSAVTMTTVGYGDKSPQSTGGKIVALIWMFTAVMFISGFTASIASSLTVNQLNWNPKEIYDFKEQRTGTVRSAGTLEYLKTHFFKKVSSYEGLTDGLQGLLDNEIDVFLYDEPILRHRIANDKTYETLEILPIKFDLQFYAFAFTKGHDELERKVSQKILEYTESMEWRLILAEHDLFQL